MKRVVEGGADTVDRGKADCGVKPLLQMGVGEGADAGADGGEAVLAGRGEVAREIEGGEGIGVTAGDFGGDGVAKKIREENHEAAHERRIGVGVEVEQAVAKLGGEPDGGNATEDAVLIGANRGEWRMAAGAIDGEGEAFVDVVDGGEVLDELGEFGFERHARRGGEIRTEDVSP